MKKAKNLNAAKYRIERLKSRIRSNKQTAASWQAYEEELREMSIRQAWHRDRLYEEYDVIFRGGLSDFFGKKTTIRNVFLMLSNGGKKEITILEDGAGDGKFLSTAKQNLTREGIKCRTIALSLHKNQKLKEAEKRGLIDKAVKGMAEFYLPKKPVSMVVALFGSTAYTLQSLRKDHVLKFALSLEKGGIMMVGFRFFSGKISRLDVISKGLSAYPIDERRLDIETEMAGVERAFQKKGFRAKFYKFNNYMLEAPPNYILIVQRER